MNDMTASLSTATVMRSFRTALTAVLGVVAIGGTAQAQGFLDPRDGVRLEFGWGDPLPDDGRAQAEIFAPIMTFGELVSLGDGRTAWRPYAARGWRPYTDGSWDFIPGRGWTWSGMDPWSQITDHSGFWRDDPQLGWVWIPAPSGGRAPWEPARVEWRLGADAIGWAPMSESGRADPGHFVFIPVQGLIRPGETGILDRAASLAAYDGSEALSAAEVASLSPQALQSHAAARRGAAPRIARLPEIDNAPPLNEPAPGYDTRRPQGRLSTPPATGESAATAPSIDPPLTSAPPPVPTQRPSSLAALPEPTAPVTPTTTPPASGTSTARPTPSPQPEVSAEASPDEDAPAAAPSGGTGTNPRVVGPQWLANGDCSSRGIREGRCKSE